MTLTFYRSTQVDQNLRVKIGYIEGITPKVPLSSLIEDPALVYSFQGSRDPVSFIAQVQVVADAKPLTIPVYTTYKPPKAAIRWNEWLELPIKVSQLPLSSLLAITVWGPSGNADLAIYGGTTIPIFTASDNCLCQGRQKLRLWLNEKADGLPDSKTSYKYDSETKIDNIEQLIKRHQYGEIAHVEWLDNLVFRRIEAINRQAMAISKGHHSLYVEFPMCDHDVVFYQHHYELAQATVSDTQQLNTTVAVFDEGGPDEVIATYDPDLSRETPIEAKYRRLVRSASDDKDFRPNARIRDELATIMGYASVRELSSNDKNLIWRFRYYLTRHKEALTKFVKSVAWDDSAEAAKALEVLKLWSEIDVAAALDLLGPDVQNPEVRAYAVDRLRTASNSDLELFLLQLVEALKFEQWQRAAYSSYLAKFLIDRAVQDAVLGNFFYWYVSVQTRDPRFGPVIYQPILKHYLNSLPGTPNGDAEILQIRFQVRLINKLLEADKVVKQSKESRPKRIELLRDYFSDPKNELVSFLPTALPLDPSIVVVGCVTEECSVFKSTMQPLKVTFRVQGGGKYSIIFKSGDDLRQDQLVMQIFQLMDQLLRNENLDLRLMPYRILATSPVDGIMQFIANETLSHVLSEYHGILPFLRIHNADPGQPLGVKPDVMDNFVRSSAGYAVITYLLGVGDRHLDNLLITTNGYFFHIDFGYILGQDPKPFPPMIKLPIQLIDGMGGINSENYVRFRSYCFTAFTTLRKSSNLILALFNLMSESGIPSILLERNRAVHKVEERFCLDMSEEEAILHFQNLINDSVNAFMPMVIDRLHSLAQYWRA